jgi:ferredoxin/flavodoxin---NADP+ reductase
MSEPAIAIVGSGPSGFFAAEALLKSDVGARVAMFDRLPTPYGLVRSGVAPDHQQIKQVVKVFDTIAINPRFSFHGNVEIGRDISLDWLRSRYDAVVLAYGASGGTSLSIPGSGLSQSMTATDFVGWYNGHPDFTGINPRFDHESAVVVGNGNVAIDVARILLSDHARLATTDIADHALEALRESRVRRVHFVGRRGPLQASFTTAELRELLGLPGVRVVVDPDVTRLDEDERAFLDLPVNAVIKRNIGVISDAASRSHQGTTKELHLNFLASPVAIEGVDRVETVHLARNRLEGPVDTRRAVPDDARFSIPAGLAIASIGFRGRAIDGVPFDARRNIIPNREGRVTGVAEGGAPLYVAGWIKRGATGIIGTNRADAAETVRTLLSDFRDGRWSVRSDRLRANPALPCPAVDFADWKRIDEVERVAGGETGRPRRKVVIIDDMIEIVRRGRAATMSSQPAA